ncbi:hypothetical protein QYF36_008692 [Acer negundo]|nr:hypothetical protein QYF36_008692 [Acer negundo]
MAALARLNYFLRFVVDILQDDDEADTVGCCTLKVSNVECITPNNLKVAISCNHQRTVSKSPDAQMSKLIDKIEELKDVIKDLKIDLDRPKIGKP